MSRVCCVCAAPAVAIPARLSTASRFLRAIRRGSRAHFSQAPDTRCTLAPGLLAKPTPSRWGLRARHKQPLCHCPPLSGPELKPSASDKCASPFSPLLIGVTGSEFRSISRLVFRTNGAFLRSGFGDERLGERVGGEQHLGARNTSSCLQPTQRAAPSFSVVTPLLSNSTHKQPLFQKPWKARSFC